MIKNHKKTFKIMEKEFVPYKIAIALKEIGFDNVNCLAVYTALTEDDEPEMDGRGTQYYAQKGWKDGVLCPLYQQAFRWIRQNHKLDSNMDMGYSYPEGLDERLKQLIETIKLK